MFSMKVHIARVEALKARMRESGLDAMLFTKDANQRYFEGYTGSDCYLLITEEKNYIFADSRYTEQAADECATAKVVPHRDSFPSYFEGIAALCKEHGVRRLGFESASLTYDQYSKVNGALRNIDFIAAESMGESVRMVKSAEEISKIERACDIADRALERLLPSLVPGVSELEAARELEYWMAKEGSENISFPTIIAFGARTSLPHAIPQRDVFLKKGNLILIDYGACFGGYHSDTTRTFVCGEATAEQRERYAVVLEAHKRGAALLLAGNKGSVPHEAALSVMEEAGYPKGKGGFMHGLGHGVGLEIHELPFMRGDCATVFEPGHVITVEPGLYIEGWGGIRIEDTVHVTEGSPRSLIHFPKDHLIELG